MNLQNRKLIMVVAIFLLGLIAALTLCASAHAAPTSAHPLAYPLEDQRYCGEPERDARGDITRSKAVYLAFRKAHPCPATGLTTGACFSREGDNLVYWYVDHVIPRAVGGCDSVTNMQWLPAYLKTCPRICKDQFERKIYADPFVKP